MEKGKFTTLLQNLSDKTKELDCLYKINKIMMDQNVQIEQAIKKIIEIIPDGLRYTTICVVQIVFENTEYHSPKYKLLPNTVTTQIIVDGIEAGTIKVGYLKKVGKINAVFLPDEINLLNTIATKLSNFILIKKLHKKINEIENTENKQQQKNTVQSNLNHWLKELQLSDKEIKLFTKLPIHFKKGETMCKQGSITSYIMLISDGLSKNYLEGNQERGYNFSIVKPFDFIGLSSLYGSLTYHFSGTALTPCTVYIIENIVFKEVIASNSAFALKVLEWYCNVTERHLKRLSCIANKQALGRVAEILLYLKDDIFQNKIIKSYITRKDIAELAAMSTESAIRILSDLKKDNIIKIAANNNIEIADPKLLKTLSHAG